MILVVDRNDEELGAAESINSASDLGPFPSFHYMHSCGAI